MSREGARDWYYKNRDRAILRISAWAKAKGPEYKAYMNAKYRCRNPRCSCYRDYGGRGIEFRFESFDQFFAELGPRPDGMTLDRIDNDGHYEPGNVQWANQKQQIRNRRSGIGKKISKAMKGKPWSAARRAACDF